MLPIRFYFPFIKKIFGFAKKIMLVILVYGVVLALFAHFFQKDRPKITSDPVKRNRVELYKTINDPELKKTKQGQMTIAMYKISSCMMVGEGCTNNPEDGDKNFSKSVFGFVTNLIVMPYQNPPASGVMWAYNGLQNAGFIPKTYAATGIGFGAIQPFSTIWVAFRDVAYTVLVLIIIAIGFMVMFRMKLNPQTVISVENALPKIVMSLFLITFSFAIAGFLIDLMYLSIAILVAILGPLYSPEMLKASLGPISLSGATPGAPAAGDVAMLQQKYILATPGDIFSGLNREGSLGFLNIFFTIPNALLSLIPEVGAIVRSLGAAAGLFWVFPWIMNHWTWLSDVLGGMMGDLTAQLTLAEIVGGTFNLGHLLSALLKIGPLTIILTSTIWIGMAVLTPVVIGLFLFLTVLFLFFRIFLLILNSYGKILLSVVIAPLYLIFEAIPGQNAFSNWLKGLIAELIAFPTLVGIFLMGSIIIDKAASGTTIQFPFMVGIDPKSFSLILGMIILFMTPDLIKIVKQLIVPKPGPLDQVGIGVLFGGATTGVSTGLGELQKYAGMAYYIQPVRSLLMKIPGANKVFADHQGQQHPPG